MNLSPKEFGLPPRTVLEQLNKQAIAIVIDRKSRIIMADGRKILEKAKKIGERRPDAKVSLKTSAPVCSKTVRYLESAGIEIIRF